MLNTSAAKGLGQSSPESVVNAKRFQWSMLAGRVGSLSQRMQRIDTPD